ncbi:hypothetical protein CPB84DRAFT_1844102 [Gymnopilus junonius]|uniref:Uncharacterized protein n=1 Tax=Gymnopilus junonius TaxID=109634 RepID=A0A9P5TQM1_GYMJU|nr:hypothetical protein CPB84DRAFT_1844102 [Gymnopilus junonius]
MSQEPEDVKPKLNLNIAFDGQQITVKVKVNMKFAKIFEAAEKRFGKDSAMTFSTRREKPLVKVFSTFAERMNMDTKTLRFYLNQDRIRPEQTPAELNMEDGEEIDATLMQRKRVGVVVYQHWSLLHRITLGWPHYESENEIGAPSSRYQKFNHGFRDVVQRNTGLLLFVASQAFYSMMDTAVKVLHGIDPPVTTLQLIIVRMSITFVCCMIYMHIAGIPDPLLGPKGIRHLLLLRGFGGFFGLFGIYYSLQYLSLSDAVVLTFLTPTCTAIAGSAFLGEGYHLRQAVASLVSLAGVILIARPATIFGHPSDLPGGNRPGETVSAAHRLLAVGAALLGVVGSSTAYTTIRAIGKRAHFMHNMVFFSMVCVVVSSVSMVVTRTPIIIPRQLDWLSLLVMIGIFGFVAQMLMTMGLQRGAAGHVTMALYTQIVFAVILEYIFFHTIPQVLSIIGTTMIITSAIYIALTKRNEKTSPIPTFSSERDGLERPLLSEDVSPTYDGRTSR